VAQAENHLSRKYARFRLALPFLQWRGTQGLGKDLYPTLSVFENLDFHGRLFGLSHAERQRHMNELLKATNDPLSRRQFWELIGNIRARRPGMSVIVSTAYMDEAQQFEWTCAMYGGKVIAAGKTPEILQKTGEKTLEAAFIGLLPEEKRAEHSFKPAHRCRV
jgi:ribosome-dependent ATPase